MPAFNAFKSSETCGASNEKQMWMVDGFYGGEEGERSEVYCTRAAGGWGSGRKRGKWDVRERDANSCTEGTTSCHNRKTDASGNAL